MKRAFWPTATLPMSPSSTMAEICILARSSAMTNRVGALRLAATVWPTSILREMTMPSMGERTWA